MRKGHNLGKAGDLRILVGIVTLNRLQKLAHTLTACRSLGFDQVVIVDNGSSDGTRDFLRSQTDVSSIFSEQNEGGSGGFSRIMRYFFEQTDAEFLLLMDDDAYPSFDQNHLLDTIAAHSPRGYMAYACKVTYPDGTLCEMNRPGKNILIHHPFSQAHRDFHIDDTSTETVVDFAGFVGLVLTREAIRSSGVVSKQFFIYSDDTYYTLSISRLGGKILYCPQLIFTHDCRRSSRDFSHHDRNRIERDVVNKIVMIREFSRFVRLYIFLYLGRLLWKNPRISLDILRAARKGVRANLSLFRNQPI